MTLSLCLIVKDEESNIQDCIDSFSGLFDELIVVDTGSSDKTKNLAVESGAKVFDFEWKNDFSSARNFAISKANSDYIMMIDADDRMKEEDKLRLLERFKKVSEGVNGIFLPLRLVSKKRKTN